MTPPLSLAAILPACALALSACSSVAPVAPAATTLAQEVRQTGEIVDLRNGQRLNPEQLLARLAAAPRVIVGEEHDQLSHHRIQQWLLVQLQGQRAQGAVLLEMLNPDQQAKVDEVKPWLQSDPVVRSEHVAKLLAWQPSWKWELYGDMVMEAMRAPYPVWSANLDRSEIKQLFAAQPALQGKHSNLATEAKVRAQQEKIIREMHDNQIDAPRLAAMLSVQQQRDRRMAERLLAAPAPALLIAGGYHAAKDMGVPLHVQDLTGSAPPTVLMLAQRGAPITAQQADFVWFTPLAPAAAGSQ